MFWTRRTVISLLLIPLFAALLFYRQTRQTDSKQTSTKMTRAPVIAISHGGGPLPILGDPGHKDIIESLTGRVPEMLKLGTPEAPRAIVLVTAHWSQSDPTISNGERHSLYYDYYNFPKEAYNLTYAAPGSPKVAGEVVEVLRKYGLNPKTDDERGWDHGVFVPMMLINPSANVPVIQLSVLTSEDPDKHLAMGRALGELRDSGVAIVGSGFASIHNLRAMRDGTMQDPAFVQRNKDWSQTLGEAVEEEDPQVREKKLTAWREFPNSYEMHPKNGGEHFMPLLVCAGAGGAGKAGKYSDDMRGIKIWSYYWN